MPIFPVFCSADLSVVEQAIRLVAHRLHAEWPQKPLTCNRLIRCCFCTQPNGGASCPEWRVPRRNSVVRRAVRDTPGFEWWYRVRLGALQLQKSPFQGAMSRTRPSAVFECLRRRVSPCSCSCLRRSCLRNQDSGRTCVWT